jgi:hypothetical protein
MVFEGDADVQVPMGLQHEAPELCHSCFWIVVILTGVCRYVGKELCFEKVEKRKTAIHAAKRFNGVLNK